MDTIEQPGAVDPALYKLYDSNRLQDLRCKTRMIETLATWLASSSYRRRSGRVPDALKYGLQSGPRRVLSRHLHKSRRFSILF